MKRGFASARRWHVVSLLAGSLMLFGCVDTVKKDDAEFLKEVRSSAADITQPVSEVGSLPGTSEDPGSLPSIEVATTKFDMGVIANDKLAHADLTVKNVGKSELVISDVKTSCGCTQGKIVDNKIPPGGETVIKVTVDPNRVYGFESTKTLTIFSNDPQKNPLEVSVHARLTPEFVLEPGELDFGAVEKGNPSTLTATMRQNTDETLNLKNVTVQGQVSDWLDVSFAEKPEDQWQEPGKREYDISVTLKPGAPSGPLAANVLLQPELTRVKRYFLPVKGTIQAFYTLLPQVGNFGPATPGKTIENVLRIAADKPFSIVSATATPPTITLNAHDAGEGNSKAIDVTVTNDAALGTYSGMAKVVLEGDGKQYTENVRLVGVVQPPQDAAVAPASHEVKPVVPVPSAANPTTAPTPPAVGADG